MRIGLWQSGGCKGGSWTEVLVCFHYFYCCCYYHPSTQADLGHHSWPQAQTQTLALASPLAYDLSQQTESRARHSGRVGNRRISARAQPRTVDTGGRPSGPGAGSGGLGGRGSRGVGVGFRLGLVSIVISSGYDWGW